MTDEKIIRTFLNKFNIDTVTFEPRFNTTCVFSETPMTGHIEITYWPGARLLEFDSFEKWLSQYEGLRTSAEALCSDVFLRLKSASDLSPRYLRVTVVVEEASHGPCRVTRSTPVPSDAGPLFCS
jgi:NADPH-dependent 7-cyano-7-deazaguanine reductase QueF